MQQIVLPEQNVSLEEKKVQSKQKIKFFRLNLILRLKTKNVPLEQMFRWKKIKNVLLELTEKKRKNHKLGCGPLVGLLREPSVGRDGAPKSVRGPRAGLVRRTGSHPRARPRTSAPHPATPRPISNNRSRRFLTPPCPARSRRPGPAQEPPRGLRRRRCARLTSGGLAPRASARFG